MNTTSKEILDSRLGFELSDIEATKLAGLMQPKELRGGDYLIFEGTTDDSLYVIVEGNLEVVKRTAATVLPVSRSSGRDNWPANSASWTAVFIRSGYVR